MESVNDIIDDLLDELPAGERANKELYDNVPVDFLDLIPFRFCTFPACFGYFTL